MRGDPQKGVIVSLLFAGVGALWLLGQWIAADAVWEVLGSGMHAITMLAIFVLVSGLAVAGLFRGYARVKADLLAGRNVVAQWRVDARQLETASPIAIARDESQRRGALYTILFFLAVIFGAFALFDPEIAPFMLGMAALVGAIVSLAFWLGNRSYRRQWQMRSGEVIVGRDGLLFNGVLHVWNTMLSWPGRAHFDEGPPPMLTITYKYAARTGAQPVHVQLPVPPERIDEARKIVAALGKGARRRTKPRQV